MTKQEIKELNSLTQDAIKYIEKTLKVSFFCYDNIHKLYKFKVTGTYKTLDISREVMLSIYNYK